MRSQTAVFASIALHGTLLVCAFALGSAHAAPRRPAQVTVQTRRPQPPPAPPRAQPLPVEFVPEVCAPQLRTLTVIEPVQPIEPTTRPLPGPPAEVPRQRAELSLVRVAPNPPPPDPSPQPEPPPPEPPAPPSQPHDRVAATPLPSNAPPQYPQRARQRGWQGTVVLAVDVAADGQATQVRVTTSSGYRVLDDAAVKAVRRWQFQPARTNGATVAMTTPITVEFRLQP